MEENKKETNLPRLDKENVEEIKMVNEWTKKEEKRKEPKTLLLDKFRIRNLQFWAGTKKSEHNFLADKF